MTRPAGDMLLSSVHTHAHCPTLGAMSSTQSILTGETSLKNASMDGSSTKVLLLGKKKRQHQSPNLKIIKKPVCVERLFILKNVFSNF